MKTLNFNFTRNVSILIDASKNATDYFKSYFNQYTTFNNRYIPSTNSGVMFTVMEESLKYLDKLVEQENRIKIEISIKEIDCLESEKFCSGLFEIEILFNDIKIPNNLITKFFYCLSEYFADGVYCRNDYMASLQFGKSNPISNIFVINRI